MLEVKDGVINFTLNQTKQKQSEVGMTKPCLRRLLQTIEIATKTSNEAFYVLLEFAMKEDIFLCLIDEEANDEGQSL